MGDCMTMPPALRDRGRQRRATPARYLHLLRALPPIRLAKVQAIRAAIAAGKYDVSRYLDDVIDDLAVDAGIIAAARTLRLASATRPARAQKSA